MSNYIEIWAGDYIRVGRFKVPAKPYANLEDLRRKEGWKAGKKLEDTTFWPCLSCGGTGQVYDPNDPYDLIEGNKMRSRITCPQCQGSGATTRKNYVALYQHFTAQYRENLAAHRRTIDVLKAALEKLTLAEIEVLSETMGHYEGPGLYESAPHKIRRINVTPL